MTVSRTMIPAAAGWYVATFVRGMSGSEGWPDGLSLTPIIGWDIEREEDRHTERDDPRRFWYDAIPILPSTASLYRPLTPWAIKAPDGRYIMPDGCTWEASEDEVVAELRDNYTNEGVERRRVANGQPPSTARQLSVVEPSKIDG